MKKKKTVLCKKNKCSNTFTTKDKRRKYCDEHKGGNAFGKTQYRRHTYMRIS